MENRLEILRAEIDRLIGEGNPEKVRYFASHLYGVSKFCVLLAKKRGFCPELAATAGMLHDIYQVTSGISENHAAEGAKVADKMLRAVGLYSDDEIAVITTAISRHSDKTMVHQPFDELLKDADVMDHCFYNPGFPVVGHEITRYRDILTALNMPI